MIDIDKILFAFEHYKNNDLRYRSVKQIYKWSTFSKYKKIALIEYLHLKGKKYLYSINKNDKLFEIIRMGSKTENAQQYLYDNWVDFPVNSADYGKQYFFFNIEDAITKSGSKEDLIYYFK